MATRYGIVGCTYCGTCSSVCPVGAIRMTREGAIIDADACTGCGKCYDNCPYEAIVPYEAGEEAGKERQDDQLQDG